MKLYPGRAPANVADGTKSASSANAGDEVGCIGTPGWSPTLLTAASILLLSCATETTNMMPKITTRTMKPIVPYTKGRTVWQNSLKRQKRPGSSAMFAYGHVCSDCGTKFVGGVAPPGRQHRRG